MRISSRGAFAPSSALPTGVQELTIETAGLRIEAKDDAVVVDVLVVPGASSDGVAGVHGASLRVRVSAPPERGKANAGVCRLLAGLCGVRRGDVSVIAGLTSRRKTVRIRGVRLEDARAALTT